MRLATVMKRIDTSQTMIEFKMMAWERMLDVPTKDGLFVSITSMMDKVKDPIIQLEAIGEETHTGNSIVLGLLSKAAALMGLSIVDSRTAGEKASRESARDYM